MNIDSTLEKLELEFESLKQIKNTLPETVLDVVYIFSGVEKHRLIGSSKDRLEIGVKVWQKLAKNQNPPPIFLFQGNNDWLTPVKTVFASKRFDIPKRYLRLELVKSWKSTLDQFLQIPEDLKSKKNWLIVTSPWHIPRVKLYAQKYWPEKLVYYWSSPVRPKEFAKYLPLEIEKIIAYAKKGDL